MRQRTYGEHLSTPSCSTTQSGLRESCLFAFQRSLPAEAVEVEPLHGNGAQAVAEQDDGNPAKWAGSKACHPRDRVQIFGAVK